MVSLALILSLSVSRILLLFLREVVRRGLSLSLSLYGFLALSLSLSLSLFRGALFTELKRWCSAGAVARRSLSETRFTLGGGLALPLLSESRTIAAHEGHASSIKAFV